MLEFKVTKRKKLKNVLIGESQTSESRDEDYDEDEYLDNELGDEDECEL